MVTKEQVKNAMECKWRLRQSKTYLILLLFTLITGAVGAAMRGLDFESTGSFFAAFGIFTAIFGCIWLPFILYPLWQYITIVRGYESYEVYPVLLDRPSTSSMYRGAVYYTVEFTTKDNKRMIFDTKPLWSSSAFAEFYLDEYNNKKINILYDRDRARVIVLGSAQ